MVDIKNTIPNRFLRKDFIMTEFGRILRIIRINTGDTAKQMASKLYISPSYLSAIENGKRSIPSNLITNIVNIYNLSEKDKMRLRNAVLNSYKPFRIDLTDFSEKKQNLLLAILQGELSDKTINEMYDLTFSKKKENENNEI